MSNKIFLSKEETLRYSRHLIMPEVGVEGQKKIKAASVLIVGVGGLGSPVGMYLAAAGVGKLGLVDFDTVDESNLQRQIMYSTEDVGRSKLVAVRECLASMNTSVQIETYEMRLTSENALGVLKEYDIVVDGTDNFPTRYLVNDACVLLGKPNVYGSVLRFDGQVSVFDAKCGPCYRCLYPLPPPSGLVTNCAESGVLGVLPGIIGTMQALETIKLILGQNDTLIGRLILFDALKFQFREIRVRKNPSCPICGEKPTIHDLIDYEQFCGVKSSPNDALSKKEDQITVEELKKRLDRGDDLFLLDVREPHEHESFNIGGYHIPLNDLLNRLHELDSSRETVVYCKIGQRGAQAVEFLKKAGFKKLRNLIGGIDAWTTK